MGKKAILAIILASFVTAGAFAVPDFRWSVGGGGYFRAASGSGSGYRDRSVSVPGGGWVWVNQPVSFDGSYFGGGIFLFLDATFVKLSVGIGGSSGTLNLLDERRSGFELDFGLLGKYPFIISNQLTAFPLFGINTRFVEMGSIFHGAFSLQFGGGLDFFVTNNVFMRGQVLYGFSPSSWNSWSVDNISSLSENSSHSFTMKLSLGYRFERRQRQNFFEWD